MVPSEYIVNHGREAFLGRFVNRAGEAFTRGDRVVIGTARGIETGNILSESAPHLSHLVGVTAAGEIIRRMTNDDVYRETQLECESSKHIAAAQAPRIAMTVIALVMTEADLGSHYQIGCQP